MFLRFSCHPSTELREHILKELLHNQLTSPGGSEGLSVVWQTTPLRGRWVLTAAAHWRQRQQQCDNNCCHLLLAPPHSPAPAVLSIQPFPCYIACFWARHGVKAFHAIKYTKSICTELNVTYRAPDRGNIGRRFKTSWRSLVLYCRGESGSGVTVIGGDEGEHLPEVMTTIVTKKSTNTVMTVVGRVMTGTINFVTLRTSMIMTAQSQGSSL